MGSLEKENSVPDVTGVGQGTTALQYSSCPAEPRFVPNQALIAWLLRNACFHSVWQLCTSYFSSSKCSKNRDVMNIITLMRIQALFFKHKGKPSFWISSLKEAEIELLEIQGQVFLLFAVLLSVSVQSTPFFSSIFFFYLN